MNIYRERGGVRWPGRFELYWNQWGLAAKLEWLGRDAENDWTWLVHFHVLMLQIFIHFPLPWIPSWNHNEHNMGHSSFGFTYHERAIHWHWGETKVMNLPWAWKRQRHEVLRPDKKWVPFVGSWERDKKPDRRWTATYPYRYVLNDGREQLRTATVYVERRFWTWRCLAWLPWSLKSRQSISVSFDDEVGEGTGSWKGGCVGCGYDMKPDETPEQTLRRMEWERRFN